MRKISCFVLAVTMLLSLSACAIQEEQTSQTATPLIVAEATPTPEPIYDDEELARAVSLGIGKYEEEHVATCEEFYNMLEQVVRLTDADKLSSWHEELASTRSKRQITRFEAMMATLKCAVALGSSFTEFNTDWLSVNNKIGEKVWDEIAEIPDPYRWISNDTYYHSGGFTKDTYIYDWDFTGVAYRYAMGRMSFFSGETLFEYDEQRNSMRPSDALLYSEALKAAVRLFDSNVTETDRTPTSDDLAIIQAAEVRKEQILNTPTTVTVTGTSYYVSNSGDDSNDGRTPETAWATIKRVNNNEFHKGDGIFFERGGLFRGQLWYKSDITYSAYGLGAKPIINMSPEDGADPTKWSLLEGTSNIWVFYKDMYDTGGIIFNNGESWATRHTALWNGEEYVEPYDQKTPINVRALEVGTFFSLPDFTGLSQDNCGLEKARKGKIYLRCDEGNPGNVYQNIEFICATLSNGDGVFILQTGPNVTIDNLCFLYGANGLGILSNCVVQNCEIGWVGGIVQGYNGSGVGTDQAAVIRCGDGILFQGGDNAIVRNNYVHHCYDYGINVETGTWQTNKERYAHGYLVESNIIERCAGGTLIGDWDALINGFDYGLIFEDISITNNYYMYTGYGWSHLDTDFDWGVASTADGNPATLIFAIRSEMMRNILISKNVFYLDKYYIINEKDYQYSQESSENLVAFSGNTYAQNNFSHFIYVSDGVTTDDVYYSFNASEEVLRLLGDKEATILPVQQTN